MPQCSTRDLARAEIRRIYATPCLEHEARGQRRPVRAYRKMEQARLTRALRHPAQPDREEEPVSVAKRKRDAIEQAIARGTSVVRIMAMVGVTYREYRAVRDAMNRAAA